MKWMVMRRAILATRRKTRTGRVSRGRDAHKINNTAAMKRNGGAPETPPANKRMKESIPTLLIPVDKKKKKGEWREKGTFYHDTL